MTNPLESLHHFIDWCHSQKELFREVAYLAREQALRYNDPHWDEKIPSDVSLQPYVVNYYNRRHIFAYNASTSAIVLVDRASEYSTTLNPQAWTNISFPSQTQLLATKGPATFKCICTDEIYAPSSPISGAVTSTVFSNNGTAVTFTSPDIIVGAFHELAIDIVFTSFTGGTAPTITYVIKRKDAFNNYNEIYTTGSISAAKTVIESIGAGMGTGTLDPADSAEGVSFANVIQISYTTTGAPTSVTQSISIIGKS